MAIRSVPEGWQSQYQRMKRSYEKLQGNYSNFDMYQDDLYHFFQDAWHLKDWLKNDEQVSADIAASIESLVREVESLRLVADLANGTKHLILTKNVREEAKITQKRVIADLEIGKLRTEWTVSSREGDVLAENLVSKVMTDWGSLLSKLELSPS